jgi:hypothetical protein
VPRCSRAAARHHGVAQGQELGCVDLYALGEIGIATTDDGTFVSTMPQWFDAEGNGCSRAVAGGVRSSG